MNQQQKNTPLDEIEAGHVLIEVTGTGKQCIETINSLLADGYKLTNVENTEGCVPFVYRLYKKSSNLDGAGVSALPST